MNCSSVRRSAAASFLPADEQDDLKVGVQPDGRILVPTGALLALDAVQAAALGGGISRVQMTTRKPPAGLEGMADAGKPRGCQPRIARAEAQDAQRELRIARKVRPPQSEQQPLGGVAAVATNQGIDEHRP